MTDISKETVMNDVQQKLATQGLGIVSKDEARPWGGFFVVDEGQAQLFADLYFNGIDVTSLKRGGRLSPKILVVAPHSRLSWQYHHRRSEIWQVVQGIVGIKVSDDDREGELKKIQAPARVILRQGERHRLIGLDSWAIVAEIWQHTDVTHPSDESDIVRLEDDYGR